MASPTFAVPLPCVSNALKALTVRDDGLPLTESTGGESPVTFSFSFLACYAGLGGEILRRQAVNPRGTCTIHTDKVTASEGDLAGFNVSGLVNKHVYVACSTILDESGRMSH
jgi:hypothetical protein